MALHPVLAVIHSILAQFVAEQCADRMIVEGNLLDSVCLRLTLSKALGYGVVLGATIGTEKESNVSYLASSRNTKLTLVAYSRTL